MAVSGCDVGTVGVVPQVDGQFKIINNAYPYIASRVLTDPQLQNSLEFMVFTSEKRLRWRRFENLLESASEFGLRPPPHVAALPAARY